MLQKRRDLGSMPDGLGIVNEDIIKGSLVVRTIASDGEIVYKLPETEEEASNVYGFVTLRIDDKLRTEKHYDTIEANTRAVCYTLVKNNEWATTEFVGTETALQSGTKLSVGYEGKEKGKLVVATGSSTPLFEVVCYTPALGGYEDPLLTVKVL